MLGDAVYTATHGKQHSSVQISYVAIGIQIFENLKGMFVCAIFEGGQQYEAIPYVVVYVAVIDPADVVLRYPWCWQCAHFEAGCL